MTKKYIELNRHFFDLPTDYEPNDHEDLYSKTNQSIEINWKELLTKKRVVILAEAGSGKTKEIQFQTKLLQKKGVFAFFIRLEFLAEGPQGFEGCFDIGNMENFDKWLEVNDEAYFFLDSVDEARLKDSSDFEKALRNLKLKIKKHLKFANIYITSRASEWRPQSDLEIFKSELPLEYNAELDEKENARSHEIVVLAPLNQKQIKCYAEKKDTQNIETFLTALEQQKAEVFATRPLDLEDLLEFWNIHNRIGNQYELLNSSIQSKLKETNPKLTKLRSMSENDLLQGLEQVAASATLQRVSRIYLLESTGNSNGIDISKILTDWTPPQRAALLKLAVFDNEIYGTVRFHHRVVREFLTAEWIIRLLDLGKSIREIERLLFKEEYGVWVIIPTMRPVIPWLCLQDDRILGRVLNIEPDILIEFGDPKSIPRIIKENIIRNQCKSYLQNSPARKSYFNFYTLERFAEPGLSNIISELITTYKAHPEIIRFLIRLVWHGGIKGCHAEVYTIALDETKSLDIRALAIHAYAGSVELTIFFELCNILLIQKIQPEIATALFDDAMLIYLPNDVVLATLNQCDLTNNRKKDLSSLKYHLPRWFEESNELNLEPVINRVLELINSYTNASSGTRGVEFEDSWLFKCLILGCEKLIKVKDTEVFKKPFLDALHLCARYANHLYFIKDNQENLKSTLNNWEELKQVLFWHDMNLILPELEQKNYAFDPNLIQIHFQSYAVFEINDFAYIYSAIRDRVSIKEKRIAFNLAYHLYIKANKPKNWLKKLNQIVANIPELMQDFEKLQPPSSAKIKEYEDLNLKYRKDAEIRQREREKNHAKAKTWLKKKVGSLTDISIAPAGQLWNTTQFLLNEFLSKDNHYGSSNWQVLIEDYGERVAKGFRNGAVLYWKNFRPDLVSDEKSEGINSRQLITIYGLIGLAIEYKETPNWVTNLSENQAELACRYATHELNGFPDWLSELYSKYTEIVEGIFLHEVKWEIEHTNRESELHYIIDKLGRSDDTICSRLAPYLLDFVEHLEINNEQITEKLIKIILKSDVVLDANLSRISQIKLSNKLHNEHYGIWFSVWIMTEPNSAIPTLAEHLKAIQKYQALNLSVEISNFLFFDRGSLVKDSRKEYQQSIYLHQLYEILCRYIRFEDDIDRNNGGVYSPTPRDHAQDARDRIPKIIANISGQESFKALVKMANDDRTYRTNYYLEYAYQRACLDADCESWTSNDIVHFIKDAEISPKNNSELFELAANRLLDLKHELEDGDNSVASLLLKSTEETEHRKYIACWLKYHALRRYSVIQEEELANSQRPDIRIHVPTLNAAIPIELKVADKWTGADLFERLRNQLLGDYLRDNQSNHGIFLLVYLGEKKSWINKKTKQRFIFEAVIEKLQKYAIQLATEHHKVEEIKVIGINLTKRAIKSHD